MIRPKQVSSFLVVVLIMALTVSPMAYAQAPAGNGPAVPSAAQAPNQETAVQQVPLPEGWWQVPLSAPNPEAPMPFFVDQAQSPAPASGRSWTKGGKIMTAIGIPMAAIGAIVLIAGPKQTDYYSGGSTTGVRVYWKATGAIWMSAGAVLTILGLTRRR
jgi:hypothetical protein